MLCPICKTELKVTGQERLVTLDEHISCCEEISLKDKYQCLNKNCEASIDELMWGEDGAYYPQGKNWGKKYVFIDNNNGPFGSFQRKCNIMVYKHDEDFYPIKDLKIPFSKTKIDLKVSYNYESNEDGAILKRSPKLDLIINGEYYSSGIKMLIFCIKHFYRQDPKYRMKHEVLNFDWDRRWWKRVFINYVKIVHRSEYKQALQEN